MSESTTHARLVEVLASYAKTEFEASGNFALYVDKVSTDRQESPPYIGGYVPDVLVRDVPQTRIMIGEAKTRNDLEAVRSRKQMRAFLEYLRHIPDSTFVLCVPMVSKATARNLLREIRKAMPESPTKTIVLDSTGATD